MRHYLLLTLDQDVVEMSRVCVVVLHLIRGHPAMYPVRNKGHSAHNVTVTFGVINVQMRSYKMFKTGIQNFFIQN